MKIKIKQLVFEQSQTKALPESKKTFSAAFYDKTFNNIDQEAAQKAQNLRDKLKKEKKYAFEKSVGLKFEPITPDGNISLKFNQEVLAPNKLLEPYEYREILILSTRSPEGKVTYGKFKAPGSSSRRLHHAGADETKEEDNLEFSVLI